MVAPIRNKLSTARSDGSVFRHVLETTQSAEEEVQERNFRDLVSPISSANRYVHALLQWYSILDNLTRFLMTSHLRYLPEVDNVEEETMLGVYPENFYCDYDIEKYSDTDLVNGKHLTLNGEYMLYVTGVNDRENLFFNSYFTRLISRRLRQIRLMNNLFGDSE